MNAPPTSPRLPADRLATSLHGRLASGGRSYPVTITALSPGEVSARGSGLAELDGAFTVEIAFETDGGAWNPKASGPAFLHFFTARATRVDEFPGPDSLTARFLDMSATSQRLLGDFLRQLGSQPSLPRLNLSGPPAPVTRGETA